MFGLFLFHKNRALFTNLADGLMIDHLWIHAAKDCRQALICTTAESKAALEAWLAETPVKVADGVTVQVVDASASEKAIFAEIRGLLPDKNLLLLSDQAVTIAPFDEIEALDSDMVMIGEAAGGPVWFQNGVSAIDAIWGANRSEAQTIRDGLVASGLTATLFKPKKYLPVADPDSRLKTNLRLLGIGYTSNDALERSYTEEFAVIPPVFIHPDAEIYASMIGPYVSIGAGAVVERSVLENTIIGARANVAHLNLSGSLIKNDAAHTGEPALIIDQADS